MLPYMETSWKVTVLPVKQTPITVTQLTRVIAVTLVKMAEGRSPIQTFFYHFHLGISQKMTRFEVRMTDKSVKNDSMLRYSVKCIL